MTEERNWEQVKTVYLSGTESLRALAERFGIPAGTLCARAAREKWSAEKQHSTQTAEPLAAARDCVDRLLAAVQQALNEETALQATRQIKCKSKADGPDGVIDRNWVEQEPSGAIDIGRVKEFASVLEELISLKRDLYDLPTGAEAERRQLAKEKLEMAKQKLTPAQLPQLQVLFSDKTLAWAE